MGTYMQLHVWRPRWCFWIKKKKKKKIGSDSWMFGLFSFGFMKVSAVQAWSQASEVSITEWQPYYCDMDLGGDVGQRPPDHFLLDLAWGGVLCWPNLIGSVCKAWDKFTPAASGGRKTDRTSRVKYLSCLWMARLMWAWDMEWVIVNLCLLSGRHLVLKVFTEEFVIKFPLGNNWFWLVTRGILQSNTFVQWPQKCIIFPRNWFS